MAQANAQLSSHQRIAQVCAWPDDDFPRTPSKKVKRREIESHLAEMEENRTAGRTSSQTPAADPDRIADTLIGVAASIRKRSRDEVSAQHRLVADLGFDSIGLMELVVAIEERLGITVPAESVFRTDLSIRELAERIREGAASQGAPANATEVSTITQGILACSRLVCRGLFPPLMRAAFGVRTVNRDARRRTVEAMKHRGHIIIANHTSHLDGVSIFSSFPLAARKRIVVAAAQDYFYSSEARLRHYMLAGYTRAFPIKRDGNPLEFFCSVGAILDQGDSVLVFPEGTRSRTGKLGPFHPSIGQLVKCVDAPVVPLFIHGAYQLWPPSAKRPRQGTIKVEYNDPVHFSSRLGPYEIRNQLSAMYSKVFE